MEAVLMLKVLLLLILIGTTVLRWRNVFALYTKVDFTHFQRKEYNN